MSAEPAPKPDPKERADLFIATHQQKYTDALDEARQASATTTTAAWQAMYQKNMAEHKDTIRTAAETIRYECSGIKTGDTCEEFEKSIRENVKALADERIRYQARRSRTVDQYRDVVDKCNTIRRQCTVAAEETEKKQPLIDRGLAPEVAERMKKWPVVRWDDDTGEVTITDG